MELLASASWGQQMGHGSSVKNEMAVLRLFIRQRELSGSQSWMGLTWGLAHGGEREERFETVPEGPSQARQSEQG